MTNQTFSAFRHGLSTYKDFFMMELCDNKFMVRGNPVGSCHLSNFWLALAQHDVEPAPAICALI